MHGQYGFGKSVTLTAAPDQGSTFDGWNGVCSKTQTNCTFAVGPITSLKVLFARDATPPSAPGGLKVTEATRTSVSIAWTASTDNVGVAGYRVYLDDAAAGNPTQTTYAFADLVCGHSYAVAVDAVDAVGNRSPKATITAQTKPCPLAARLAGAAVKSTGGTRVVTAQLRVNRVTTAKLTLASAGRVVASGRYRGQAGNERAPPDRPEAGAAWSLHAQDHARRSRRRRRARLHPGHPAPACRDEHDPEGDSGEGRRASRNPFDYLPQIGGIVTIAATIIGLVFVFRPGCTPQDVGKATVDDVRVVQPVTFVRYLQRLKLPAGTLSREQLRRRGVMIEFHYDITGFRGKKLPLRWELNDAATNDLVEPGPGGHDHAVDERGRAEVVRLGARPEDRQEVLRHRHDLPARRRRAAAGLRLAPVPRPRPRVADRGIPTDGVWQPPHAEPVEEPEQAGEDWDQ